MSWQEIIQQYLVACVSDYKDVLTATRVGNRLRFLEAYATEDLTTREKACVDLNLTHTDQPSASTEDFRAIVDDEDLIVAEVDPAQNEQPRYTTRFRLIREDESWKLDEYFWKC